MLYAYTKNQLGKLNNELENFFKNLKDYLTPQMYEN